MKAKSPNKIYLFKQLGNLANTWHEKPYDQRQFKSLYPVESIEYEKANASLKSFKKWIESEVKRLNVDKRKHTDHYTVTVGELMKEINRRVK